MAKELILKLNETARDSALVQILVKTRVNQYLLARIFALLNQLSDEESERVVKRIEREELDRVFAFLDQEAARGSLSNWLSEDPPEEPKC